MSSGGCQQKRVVHGFWREGLFRSMLVKTRVSIHPPYRFIGRLRVARPRRAIIRLVSQEPFVNSTSTSNDLVVPGMAEGLVHRWSRPFVRFLRIEAASGMVLLVCTATALLLANSIAADGFRSIWETHARIGIGRFELDKPLHLWINDGLMTIFFFVVGLEIKREMVTGELSEPRKAALPLVAAVGGMIAPALIYLAFQFGEPGERGWGIPMATDIAFVVGFLALFGRRVPLGLKIMLLSLAIADDIGAVLVIAVVYSSKLHLGMLGLAVAGFGLTSFFNRIGVRTVTVYVVIGAGIWVAILKSGIHPTVAGVLLGLLTPANAWVGNVSLRSALAHLSHQLRDGTEGDENKVVLKGRLASIARESVSPLTRLETALHPWVGFFIMPVFALANAGVTINASAISHPISIAVAVGLSLGKPLGIVLLCWLAVKLGIARLPTGVNWGMMVGAGVLAGIGFTMSLFIAGLALPADLLDAGKIGTLMGSMISAIIGSLLLWVYLPKRPKEGEETA